MRPKVRAFIRDMGPCGVDTFANSLSARNAIAEWYWMGDDDIRQVLTIYYIQRQPFFIGRRP